MAGGRKVRARRHLCVRGDGHMFGPQAAGPDKPGNTGKDQRPHRDRKYAARAGTWKMFGFYGSQAAKAGQTGAR